MSSQDRNCSMNSSQVVKDLQTFFMAPVLLVGLVLNVAALLVFCRQRALWTDTHVYMINLALADMLLVFILPFRLHATLHDLPAPPLCSALVTLHYANMYSSIFTVTAISVQRFLAIRFPFYARRAGSKKRAACMCALIWLVIAGVCLVFHDALSPSHWHTCYKRDPHPIPLGFLLALELLGYVVPLLTMLLCSFQSMCILLRASRGSVQGHCRSVAVVGANLAVFVVCFTPVHVTLLLNFLETSKDPLDCPSYNLAYSVHMGAEMVATTNCCLDAVGYYFLCRDFRKALRPARRSQVETGHTGVGSEVTGHVSSV